MKKKKGSTLIEIQIAICMFTIIFSCEILLLFKTVIEYKDCIERNRNEYYINQALEEIQYELSNNLISNINVSENQLKLVLRIKNKESENAIEGEKSKIFLLSGNCLEIRYIDINGKEDTEKYLVQNVRDFRVLTKRKTIYIKIEDLKGRIFEKCIGIK